MNAGDVIDGYELIGQAPVDFVRGSRTRAINGRLVPGSWSDPWWGYSPELGWALIKRWKNQALEETRWSEAVPAMDTAVIEKWEVTNDGPERDS